MSKSYIRTIETDVLVAGAGFAGLGAALQAAREGSRVVLLESTDRLGGIAAVCQGMPLGCAYPCQRVIGGVFAELVDRLMAFAPPAAWIRKLPESVFGWDVYYNQDTFTYVLFEMLEEAGVHLILSAVTGDVLMDGDSVSGLEYHDMTGTNLVKAKIYIDCTGNGDVAFRAGIPYDLGDPQGRFMTYTLSFIMANVDFDKAGWDAYGENGRVDASELAARGVIPEELRMITYSRMVEPGRVYFNYIREREVNGLDPDDMAASSQRARRRVMEIYQYFREKVPGFADAYLDGMGPMLGVRDTRRFEGMHRLTKDELLRSEKFPQSGIVCCDNPFDDVARGADGAFMHDPSGKKGESYYRIPFGCLVPKKVKNLMFAGKLLSSESQAMASARGMGSCMGMGQATGIASRIAIQKQIDVQSIDPSEVVEGMIRTKIVGLGKNDLLAVKPHS